MQDVLKKIDKKIDNLADIMTDGFGRLDERIDGLEVRVDGLDGRMGKIEGRMGKIEGRMGKIEGKMGGVESGVKKIRISSTGENLEVRWANTCYYMFL